MALWMRANAAVKRATASDIPEDQFWWRRQMRLSAGFVFSCAFRSFLPRADVLRICLYDSWISCVFVGRSVATVAELCFMIQMALHLRRLADENDAAAARILSRFIVPVIVLAETCSWYAVLTTNYIGNACEETLWSVAGALLLLGCVALWPRYDARRRKLLFVPFIAGPCYLAFMASVDIPMYLGRWRADQNARRAYLTFAQGFWDITHRWVFTRQWSDWRTEIPWMTLYFSVAVWISIALAIPSRNAEKPLVESRS